MLEALKLAKLRGYYVPELDYYFKPPAVTAARWSAEDWLNHISGWFALEIH